MSSNVKITTELKNPSEVGVYHRLICMTGPKKGNVYYLTGKRIIIGRAETADIQITDTKISREHAELSYSDNSYTITDLGAQNGVVVNDSKIIQKKLLDTEKIVIGQTVFKYNFITITESAEMMLAEEYPETPLAKEIKKGGKVKIQPKAKNLSVDEEFEEKKPSKENKKSAPKTAVVAIVVLGIMYILFGEDEAEVKKAPNRISTPLGSEQDFVEKVNSKNFDDADIKKKLSGLIHSGRREFREGNYFRAMEEFRLALLLSPGNGQASYYLSKAKQRLDEEIENNFEKGNQEYDAKKYQAAIVSYCAVVQLIKEYPDDERYKNAIDKVSAVESELGLEKGEIKCFEEKSADSRN